MFGKLTAVRALKAQQIEDYFSLISSQAKTLSRDTMIVNVIQEFGAGAESLIRDERTLSDKNDDVLRRYYIEHFIPRLLHDDSAKKDLEAYLPTDLVATSLQKIFIADNPYDVGTKDFLTRAPGESDYASTHEIYHPIFREFIDQFGYYDLFLIDTDGTIIYSVFKEVDFGTSLLTGPHKDTNFAAVFRTAIQASEPGEVFFSDFEPYAPSYHAPAAFVVSPVFKDGRKLGALALQFPIDRINAIMTNNYDWRSVGLGETGETYLVGSDFKIRNQSRFLSEAPEVFLPKIMAIENTRDYAQRILEQNSTIGLMPVRTQGVDAALRGEIGTEVFPDYRNVPVLSAFQPVNLPGLNWVIISQIDEGEAFLPIYQLQQYAFIIAGVLSLIVLAVATVTARSITNPLALLVGFSKELSGVDFRKDDTQDLVHEIEPVASRGDEVGDLARAFSNLAKNLQSSVRNLIDTETDKERMAGELSIASNIQMSMLPLNFPRFPEHKDIDVWAQLHPAREIGGDFYDFFFLDDHRFGFVVADVSGKGVPAALLMAVTKTLLKTNAQDSTTTAVVIDRINNELSENNDDCMFVTVFFAILDLTTGTMTYTNAGHNPPLLMRGSGEIVALTGVHGPMVGVVGGIEYEQAEVQLNVDDKLIVFTDGVTEAFNLEGEAFGDDRLSALLERSGQLGTKFLVNAVVDEVNVFAGDAEQSDDITVFCLRYLRWEERPDVARTNLQLKNELAEIERALQAFDAFVQRANLSAETRNDVSLVLDDLLNNIVNYAFEDEGEHVIKVSFRTDEHWLIITASDDGVEFDPFLRAAKPNLQRDIDEREIGGLGIHLIENMMDGHTYQRVGGRNVVTLMKRLNQ